MAALHQEHLPDLSSIREQRGVSLEQIAENTKISIRYLRAIEAADFKQLPGGVFAVNYIRQYAQAIDYDEWDLLAAYRAAVPQQDFLPEPPPEPHKRGLMPALLKFLANLG